MTPDLPKRAEILFLLHLSSWKSSETGLVCSVAVPSSMQNANGVTITSHGQQEQKKGQTGSLMSCSSGQEAEFAGRMWHGDWQYGLFGTSSTSAVCSQSSDYRETLCFVVVCSEDEGTAWYFLTHSRKKASHVLQQEWQTFLFEHWCQQ